MCNPAAARHPDYHAPMFDEPTPALRVPTPDGRSLDLYLAGPPDGTVVLFHAGTPAAPLPFEPLVRLMADRDLRYAGLLAIGAFDTILDELVA
jgi:hypothetical protein